VKNMDRISQKFQRIFFPKSPDFYDKFQ